MGVGPRGTGLAISAGAVCAMVTGILYGRIIRRFSFQTLSALGLGVMGVGYVLVSRADSYWIVVAGLGISEGGFGLLVPNLNVWLTTVVPAATRGRAFGGLTTCVFLGQFLSPFVSQPMAARRGLAATFAVVGGSLVVAAAGYLVARRLYAARGWATR